MKFTDSSELGVGSCDARHVEQGQERFVGDACDHHLHGVRRVHDILERVENGRHDCLTGDWTRCVGSTGKGAKTMRYDSLFPMPDTLGSVKTLYSCQFARALACAR